MRSLSDKRLLPLASFLAKQKGLSFTAVTKHQRDVILDVAESALRDIDTKWQQADE